MANATFVSNTKEWYSEFTMTGRANIKHGDGSKMILMKITKEQRWFYLLKYNCKCQTLN